MGNVEDIRKKNKIDVAIEVINNRLYDRIIDAIKTLGSYGGPREFDALVDILSWDNVVTFDNYKVSAMFEIRHNITAPRNDAIAPLIKCAEEGIFPNIRRNAISTLASIGGEEVLNFLKTYIFRDAYQITYDGMRKEFDGHMVSIQALINMKKDHRDSLMEFFLSEIRKPIPVEGSISEHYFGPIKLRSRYVLGQMQPMHTLFESLGEIEDYISYFYFWHHYYVIRKEMCRALLELGAKEELFTECCNLLQDSNASIRHTATFCMGQLIADTGVVEKLKEIWIKDDNQIVSNCAGFSLLTIAKNRTKRNSDEIRKMAVIAMLAIEGTIHECRKRLYPLLDHRHGFLDESLVEIDKKLGTQWVKSAEDDKR